MTTTTSPSNPVGNTKQYLSYNKQPIEVGIKVFQVGFDSDNLPVLKEYDVIELMANGTLKLQYSQESHGFTNRFIDFSPPDKVHTDSVAMMQIWVDQGIKELELLPKRIARWEDLIAIEQTKK